MEENPTPQRPKVTGLEWMTILLTFFWVALLSPAQATVWIVQDTVMMMGSDAPAWIPAAVTAGQVALLLIPISLGVFYWRTRSPRMTAWMKTLALAALFPLFMLPLRFFPASVHPDRSTTALLFQFLGLGAYALSLRVYQKEPNIPAKGGYLPALFIAPFLLGGLWYYGAFGGMWEVVTNLALGLFYGLVMGRLLGQFLFEPLYEHSAGTGRDMLIGSHGVGAVLLITATSFGYGGQTFLFMLIMPAIALPLMGMLYLGNQASSQKWDTAAWLIGVTSASVLVLADLDEMTQILTQASDALPVLILVSLFIILISRVLGFLLLLLRNKLPTFALGTPFKVFVGALWLAAFFIIIYKPNAGLHQDRLFIILDTQADLSAEAQINDVSERREKVYWALTEHADESQKELRLWLDRFYINYEPYYLVNAIEVEGGPLIKLWLENFDGVDRVLHNPVTRPSMAIFGEGDASGAIFPTEPIPTEPQWNLTMIGADRVWEEFGVRGEGITLGQSDSGVQWDHPELLDSYRGKDGNHDFNWLDIWNGEPVHYDIGGHGTHTTGSVLGNTVGVAPDAEWFACANLVHNLGSPTKYLACMQFMLAPYPMDGDAFTDGDTSLAADVLNNSWGCPPIEGCDPTALQPGVEALRSAGIFVVASAGNEGYGGCETVSDPIALYDASFSVGAHNVFGHVTEFSSLGPVTVDGSNRIKPDILAPGENVLSAYPGDTYMSNSGTSMAGPHIAGVVALIWSANPDLIGNIDRTEEIMIKTATPYDFDTYPIAMCGSQAGTPNNIAGYGLVNAYEAVKMALEE